MLKTLSKELGAYDKEKLDSGIKEIEKLTQKMSEIIEKTVAELK